MPEVTVAGQRRLQAARVLCIGAGGLGSPAALYLAAAGVGTLGLIDPDKVDRSNLQRQILHGTADIGRPKMESARARIAAANPNVAVELHPGSFTSANAMEIVAGYDVVLDGSDNFPTRYLSSDVCVFAEQAEHLRLRFSLRWTDDGFRPASRRSVLSLPFPRAASGGHGAKLRGGGRIGGLARNHRAVASDRDAQAHSRFRRLVSRTLAALRRFKDEVSRI